MLVQWYIEAQSKSTSEYLLYKMSKNSSLRNPPFEGWQAGSDKADPFINRSHLQSEHAR